MVFPRESEVNTPTSQPTGAPSGQAGSTAPFLQLVTYWRAFQAVAGNPDVCIYYTRAMQARNNHNTHVPDKATEDEECEGERFCHQ